MPLLVGFWRGFLRLLGLDACPVPLAHAPTPGVQATRMRLERLRVRR
jgi:hypothetical protein